MRTSTRSLRTSLFLAVLLIPLGLLLLMRTPPTLAAGAAAPVLVPTSTNCTTQGDIPQVECEALVALYTSTNGASWNDSPGNNWNVTQTPCSWTGVTCTGANVSSIVRIEQNLVGSIPDLSALASLQTLNLSANQLSGSIPDLTAFTGLKYLSLYGNQLSGSIPTVLPASLQFLSLYGNQLSGSIPDLFALTSLQVLYLQDNQLSGSIPALSALSSLQALFLYNNQLSGSIPGLSALTNLQTLNLGGNQLSGNIPTILPASLQYISLYGNQLSGNIPTVLPASLQYLSLYGNQLSGSIPSTLSALTSLQVLYLQDNQLSGSIPALSALTSLQALFLYNNQLSGVVPTGVCNASSFLDLGYNKLTGEADPCVTTKDPDWAATQTVAPPNVQAQVLSTTQIQLTWTAIPYTGDGGYYEVLCSETSGGPYSSQGMTVDKTVTTLTASGLTPATPYYCVVRTYTPSHGFQQNNLTSLDSDEATATTDAVLYLPLQYHLHHQLAGD